MIFHKTPFEGLMCIEFEPRSDERGYFMRIFSRDEFAREGIEFQIAQVNCSATVKRGTLRGLHFQKSPHEETKIVSCLRGKIFDVAVDLRKESSTYRQWMGLELSPEKNAAFFIPKGFAHGFQTLMDDCEVEYLISEFYHPESAYGARWNDPILHITWPITDPLLSEKDQNWPFL